MKSHTQVVLGTVLTVAVAAVLFSVSYAIFTSGATIQKNTFTASDVFASGTVTPTDTKIPTGIQPGDVVVNEIMWMGSAEHGASDEWIELRNMTNSTIDLSNWKVDGLASGSSSVTIPSGKSISANGFFVIGNNHEASSILDAEPDFQTSAVNLNNNGEILTLRDSANTIIDTANHAGAWYAGANPSTGAKKSMERNDPPLDGTLAGNWHTATASLNLDASATDSATPKAPND